LIQGKHAVGALFVGSNLQASYTKLIYDQTSNNNLYLTGNPGDAKRYILPQNPKGYGSGWKFDIERDYLLPIQPRMLSLTGNKWVQNPKW
ncbi:MAG: RagB/SusD family nutrient uptake outer membrane protein, partial [Bacteroides sp.]